MEFGSGFSISEEEHMSKGKLPVSYSTSSSPSSSSSQCKAHLVPLAQIYANQNQHHHHQLGGSWLGTAKYDPEQEEDISRSRMNDMGAGAAKIELMDVNDEDSAAAAAGNNVIEMEHMFDKVVTPSDVGKLNRLVIPKQHAEKYFPLDSSRNEKGLLLNFEDTSGKAWRFRYSYWNSSQSYVMTKGWSRFVKEKKLDAGDIVSFQRGVGESGKYHLYIDWRRRPDAPHQNYLNHRHQQQQYHHYSSIPWSPLLKRPPTGIVPMMPIRDHLYSSSNTSRSNAYGSSYGYNYNSSSSSNYSNAGANPCSSSGTIVYMRSGAAPQQVGMGMVKWQQGGGGIMEPMVYESVPLVQGKAAAKRLRLFGVNMDCPITDSQEYHKLSSPATPMHHHHHPSMALQQQQPPQLSPSLPSHHCLQLRLYNGSRLQPSMPNATQFLHKGKSSMSLDLDI